MEDTTIQLIAIVAAVAGLLGWVVKQVLGFLFERMRDKDKTNKEQVKDFTEVINHQRTEDRKAWDKNTIALTDLAKSIDTSNEVNSKLITFLKNGHK